MKNTIAAIDFGTSKIVTLVAENSGAQRCDIVSAGIEPYDGFTADGWNNPAEVDAAIRASIQQAEGEHQKRRIHEVNVGVPATFTHVYVAEGVVQLKGTDPKVTPDDVKKVFENAKETLRGVQGVMVHSSPAWFTVDDGKKTLEPVGLKGRELRGFISVVMANQFFVDDVTMRLQAMSITPVGFFSTSTGEAILYLPEEDRDRTCVLLDMGYLCTDVMVAEGDALIFQKTIDLGGGHIAAALADALDIHLSAAEQIKRQYVYGISIADATYDVNVGEDSRVMSFTREQVTAAIEPLVDELAQEIKTTLEESGIKLGDWSKVYMTGGGLAFNRGGKDYLSGKLERPVRETPKRTVKLNSHAFSSALGLMDLIVDTFEQQRQPSQGIGGKISDFFRILLGG